MIYATNIAVAAQNSVVRVRSAKRTPPDHVRGGATKIPQNHASGGGTNFSFLESAHSNASCRNVHQSLSRKKCHRLRGWGPSSGHLQLEEGGDVDLAAPRKSQQRCAKICYNGWCTRKKLISARGKAKSFRVAKSCKSKKIKSTQESEK